jgi:hypothetical protein
MTECSVMRIEKKAMMGSASPGAGVFGHVRSLLAHFGKEGKPEVAIS